MTPLQRVVGVPLPSEWCPRAQYIIDTETNTIRASIADSYGDLICRVDGKAPAVFTCFFDALTPEQQEQARAWAKAVERAMEGDV